jgi:hypothetical protein
VGLTTLSQCGGEEPDTIEEAYEPFLLQQGSSSGPREVGWPPGGHGLIWA